MDVRFPTGRGGTTEPLLDVSAGPDSCLLSVSYVSDGEARLSLMGRNGETLQTSEATFNPAGVHEVDIRPSTGKRGVPPLTLSCTLDGSQVLGVPGMDPSGNVPILQSGVSGGQLPGVQARFTGNELRLSAVPDAGWAPPGQAWGMDVLVVTFPLNRVGRHEPLLTSGIAGAGDFIYLIYEDDHHVRIGFDHWNGIAVISNPIAVDYNAPHEIWISSGPLYPDVAGDANATALASADRARLRSGVRVAMDGKTVIASATPAYPSAPAQVTVGTNRIGGSSADSTFSGIIHFSGRMNPLAVSW
jgi:hypothetical protein